MKYYLIAGEASGDLHGANLIKALQRVDGGARFRFWGGDLMAAQAGKPVKHYSELAFMGFVEVAANLGTILKNISFCKKDILRFQPDAVIFIDYPGFNLRIAKWAKAEGFNTQYYISPQIWAWKESRIKQIKRDVGAMYVILPFEKRFYEKKHNFPVHFVGHPLLDALAQRVPLSESKFKAAHALDDRPIIALLPGSRKQEIRKMLTAMLQITPHFGDHQFVIAGAPGHGAAFYNTFIREKNVHLVLNRTYDLLSVSTAALVTSGTATLETALFKVPQVVCYKGNPISYAIAKRVIKLKYISLVNLILDRPAVTELIQHDVTPKRLRAELKLILEKNKCAALLLDYRDLETALGGTGASDKTAGLIYKSLTEKI